MIQKTYNSDYKKKTPYKFIPRRDLFPDADIPPVSVGSTAKFSKKKDSSYKASGIRTEKRHSSQIQKTGVLPVHTGNKTQHKPAQPLAMNGPLQPVRQNRSSVVNPSTLFLLLIGWIFLWPVLKKSRPKLTAGLESTIANVLDSPKSTQMLLAIGPYLEDNEQDLVYTVTGILEAANIIRDVMNHSYHDRNRSMILSVPSNPAARRLELMKSIRPYIPQHSRKDMDAIMGVYETVYKLNRNIKDYQTKHTLSGGKKITPIDSIGEILNLVSPVLPQEHREKANKIMQVLKLAEIAESTGNSARTGVDSIEDSYEGEKPRKKTSLNDEKQTGTSEQIQKVMDSFLPMMNEEQKESMNMIMKMAQLLAQPDDSPDGDEEN